MPSHRTPAVLLLLPALLAGGACAGSASAQVTDDFINSGQALGGNSYSMEVVLGDLDGDGDLDAIDANTLVQPNLVWTNDGNGSFTETQVLNGSIGDDQSHSVALGDLDGDGDLDIMFGNNGNNTVWTNDGNGTFTDSGQALGETLSWGVALGDLDGDGDLDAMIANNGQPNTVWFNRPPCTADINADGFVNGEDLTILLADWGEPISKADLNEDGIVSGPDISVLLSLWNDCP